jgi:tetratricopeptide (TPR) repeat protein
VSSLSYIRFRVAAFPRRAWVVLALISLAAGSFGAETVSRAPMPGKADEANTQNTLRAYLQLQEQLHATQLAIERNQNQAAAVASENVKAIASRLQGIEPAPTMQRAPELEAMQSSNRALLFVAGVLAALGLLAMLVLAYFQWLTINRLEDFSAVLSDALALGLGSPVAAPGVRGAPVVSVGPVEQSSQRLLGALEQLEKRIDQLERTPDPPPPKAASRPQAAPGPTLAAIAPDGVRLAMFLGKGQSLLSLEQPEEALACFDHVLALDPSHAEALVKKGAALERLRKLDEAITCYDQAIAADRSMTMAYLYKGGLLNRIERFGEALECYEHALRTQENGRG